MWMWNFEKTHVLLPSPSIPNVDVAVILQLPPSTSHLLSGCGRKCNKTCMLTLLDREKVPCEYCDAQGNDGGHTPSLSELHRTLLSSPSDALQDTWPWAVQWSVFTTVQGTHGKCAWPRTLCSGTCPSNGHAHSDDNMLCHRQTHPWSPQLCIALRYCY